MLTLKPQPDGFSFRVRAIPNAHKNSLVGSEDGVLVVRLRAPALEGKANQALLEYLAELLGLRSRQIRLEVGQRSRHKVVRVVSADRNELQVRLQGLLSPTNL